MTKLPKRKNPVKKKSKKPKKTKKLTSKEISDLFVEKYEDVALELDDLIDILDKETDFDVKSQIDIQSKIDFDGVVNEIEQKGYSFAINKPELIGGVFEDNSGKYRDFSFVSDREKNFRIDNMKFDERFIFLEQGDTAKFGDITIARGGSKTDVSLEENTWFIDNNKNEVMFKIDNKTFAGFQNELLKKIGIDSEYFVNKHIYYQDEGKITETSNYKLIK